MTLTAKSFVLDAFEIAKLIPHHGDMCLLAGVQHYDTQSIRCTATSHRLPTHPLRENGMLHAACGIEYAAQAMGCCSAPNRLLIVVLHTSEQAHIAMVRDQLGDLKGIQHE